MIPLRISSDASTTLEYRGYACFRLGEPVSDVEALATFPLLAAMEERRVKLWFYADPEQLAMLDRILELLPGLDVVLNHLGFCPDIHAGLRFDEHLRPRFDNFPLPPPTIGAIEQIAGTSACMFTFRGNFRVNTICPGPIATQMMDQRLSMDIFRTTRRVPATGFARWCR